MDRYIYANFSGGKGNFWGGRVRKKSFVGKNFPKKKTILLFFLLHFFYFIFLYMFILDIYILII